MASAALDGAIGAPDSGAIDAPDPGAGPTDPTPTRHKVVERFRRVFTSAAVGGVDVDAFAARLEKHVWNWMIQTCERDGIRGELLKWSNPRVRYRYTTRALSLEFNLKNPGNPDLVHRVASKQLSLKAFAAMTPHQMWPEHWEPVYQRVALRQMRREATVDPSTVPDGAYTCSKCKSKKTVFTSMQIRSADEPSTQFVRCLNCGKAWKD